MKKIISILMFAAVFGMLIGSVAAVDWIEHDFDGKCKVSIPNDRQWGGDQVPFGDGIHGGAISIHYFSNDDLNGQSLDDYIKSQPFEDEKTDGNLTIYKNGNKFVVLTHTDNEYLIVKDKDLEEAKKIALGADFLGNDSSNNTNEPSTPVNATVELESHDFNGSFKMNVPKGANFEETTDDDAAFHGATIYFDRVNNLNITFGKNDTIDNRTVKGIVSNLEGSGAKITKNGNLNIASMGQYNEVFFNDGNKLIIIVSDKLDADTITAMAQSVEFEK